MSRARILMIEDMDTVAGTVGRELTKEYGHEVTILSDPASLPDALRTSSYDVAVVDLLFEQHSRQLQSRLRAGEVNLSAGPLLVSGLTALYLLAHASPPVPAVVWTTAEANRRLHLIYAREEPRLRATCYCSKTPGTGTTETLQAAIEAARAGRFFAEPSINPYLPSPASATLRDTLLKDPCSRAIWRAAAAGAKDRVTISRLIPYKQKTIANQVGIMHARLREFDPGIPSTRFVQNEIIAYATRHWEFFLDDTVRQLADRLG